VEFLLSAAGAGRTAPLLVATEVVNLSDEVLSGELAPAGKRYVEAVSAVAEKQRRREFDRPAAFATHALPHVYEAEGELPLGTLVADAICHAAGAQVAIVNNGMIRGGLPKGVVTYRDLYEVAPFDDPIVAVELKGRDLLAFLLRRISYQRLDIQSAGISLDFDLSGRRGEEISNLRVGGRPVALDETYTFSTTRYLFSQTDRYPMLAGKKTREIDTTPFEALLAYVGATPLGSAARPVKALPRFSPPRGDAVRLLSPQRLWRRLTIDLNRADEELLASLPHIDERLAAAIVKRRERAHFKKIEDLLEVEGVDPASLDQFKQFLSVQ
jgi:hypothetical protein